jgi:succinyl-diaminopimelate desuccinylase
VNRRYIPDEKYEDVVREIEEAINRGKAKSKAVDVKVTYIHDYPAFRNDPNSPANVRIKKTMCLVQEISENQIAVVGSSGSTDMGFLTNYDVLIHGNSSVVSNAHGVNETIKYKDILTYIKEIIVFLCADL